jgi:hypothetical protein
MTKLSPWEAAIPTAKQPESHQTMKRTMKQPKFLITLFAIALTVSACAPAAIPTMSAEDVQSTAVAAAFTVVAQTQAAIPTATSVPPTDTPAATPLPTNTPLPLSSLEVTATTTVLAAATSSSSSGTDPCANRVLSGSPGGKPTMIRIANTTKAEVTVSLYLNETASHGECGYRSYVIKKNSDVTITDLVQGCYNLWAWSNNNNVHVNGGGSGCINNEDKWTFEIKEDSIKFVGP